MSSKMNIQGKLDIIDPHYRYKMETVIIEKQKNKTIVTNFKNISKNLNRDPKDIIKYLKKKMGIALTYKNDTLVSTKDITAQDLYTVLRQYIQEYILCETCKNPETELITKSDKLYKKCSACGDKSII